MVPLAAGQEDAQAQHNLGLVHASGRGVVLELDQAEHWFKLAANQGDADAQQELQILVVRRVLVALSGGSDGDAG